MGAFAASGGLVLVSLCHVVLGRLLQLAALHLRSNDFKELEIVVLRHELAVLRRRTRCPAMTWTDRFFLATARAASNRRRANDYATFLTRTTHPVKRAASFATRVEHDTIATMKVRLPHIFSASRETADRLNIDFDALQFQPIVVEDVDGTPRRDRLSSLQQIA
jgi:hypothetical protein